MSIQQLIGLVTTNSCVSKKIVTNDKTLML